jgi:hypothetical protein
LWNSQIRDNFAALQPGHQVLTTAQKNALSGTTTGTMVYDSTLGLLQMWNGSAWVNAIDNTVVTLSGISLEFTATHVSSGSQRVINIKTASSGCTLIVATTTPSTLGVTVDFLNSGTSGFALKGNAGVTINGVAGSGDSSVITGITGWSLSTRYMMYRLVGLGSNSWSLIQLGTVPATSSLV